MRKSIKRYSFFSILILLLLALGPALQPSAQQDSEYDFAISKQFIHWLADQKTIQPTLTIKLNARTKQVHELGDDCELHIAGTPDLEIGDPNDIVVEPPNLCKIPPPGLTASSEANLREDVWPDYLDDHFMDKTCEIRGFFRIYTEHMKGKGTAANPNHVFEIHPVMHMKAETEEISFDDYLKAFNKMSHILPSTALSIIKSKTLRVRYNKDKEQYEFIADKKTGNFAIVEVSNINKDWIRKTGGGHSAIARVTPDGESLVSLKLYTLAGTKSDDWLKGIKAGDTSSKYPVLHGLFTYDYFSIIKAIRTEEGVWSTDEKWKNVEYPLAFVVFGETEDIPWEEE